VSAPRRTVQVALVVLTMQAAVLVCVPTHALAAEPLPVVTVQSVSAVTQTSAILNATINPRGHDTHYHFEYGVTPMYGTSIPVPYADIGSGTSELVVGQQITGLEPATTYHFEVVADHTAGMAEVEDRTFTTLPPLPPLDVSTEPASGVSQNQATLTGILNTQGVHTIYEFDLGSDTTYGTRIFGDAGATTGTQTLTTTIQGLLAGTTYHYRILAINIYGEAYGADQVFTTPNFPTSLLTPPNTLPLIPTFLIAPAPTPPTKITIRPTAHISQHHIGNLKAKSNRPRGRRHRKTKKPRTEDYRGRSTR
jgi:hypothetical protein